MATLLLSAAGAAIGGSLGGTVLGLSSVVAGRFVGAVLGRAIDQRLMGQGSDTVETGRVERLRLMGTGEGDPVVRVHGRMRVAGQVIWATQFEEVVTETGGGKGLPSRPTVRDYSYRVSLAIALCEGEISGVGRVWADGAEIATDDLGMTVYRGRMDQPPDPKMEAVEGTGLVPAYRGTAYVVLEDLDLGRFGNRVPQFSFEVARPAPVEIGPDDPARAVRGVAMIPGSGEYALATTPVTVDLGAGNVRLANVHAASGKADLPTALDQLEMELPECRSVSLILCWFGDDLRCDRCFIRPCIEFTEQEGEEMPWSVAGLDRASAEQVPLEEGRPVYGGTPADASVVEAIREMTARGLKVMIYPFILMDQMAGNVLTNPWTGEAGQPVLPWRGRITGSAAPGVAGSPDGTAAAGVEVAAFFGTAAAADFTVGDGVVSYGGPDEWRYNRFILHCAALSAAAGGVDAFCIGSEMRGLTQLRDDLGFPAVGQMQALAAEVRALLPGAKLGYAADWSEYFGYQPQDGTGDRYFHLDPLWADANCDFIGIDNYMPLSDWREGEAHLDAHWGDIYALDYLRSNVEGGEGYDWYYHSAEARAAQIRTPITDSEGEPWIWRYKDIRNWWLNAHYERIGGIRQAEPTAWEPQSKPIWFTELGCAAMDKATNQPNKFLDPKSSESVPPYHSTGARDDLIAMQYLRAIYSYWDDVSKNPRSVIYDGRMLDMDRAHVWAWDSRPFPWFPANEAVWSDGANYARGHWLTGRASSRSLASVVTDICAASGVYEIDTSRLWGVVWGMEEPLGGTPRQALQALMLRFGFDAVEREGVLRFRMRDGRADRVLEPGRLALSDEVEGGLEEARASEAELAGRVRVRFVEAHGAFETVAEEAYLPGADTDVVAGQELRLVMLRGEGRQVVERWLIEAQVSRDTARLALPPSEGDLGPGDVVEIAESGLYRIDRVERAGMLLAEAVRVDPEAYRPVVVDGDALRAPEFVPPVPVLPLFLDLPLMTGAEDPVAPHLAVVANPWPGDVAVYSSAVAGEGYVFDQLVESWSVIGVTETALQAAGPGRVDRGAALRVRLTRGALASISDAALLAGGNLLAIGDGSPSGWELMQVRDVVALGGGGFDLSYRLRGQLGTDAGMPAVWPAGSYVVAMNGRPGQIALTPAQRGQTRHFRIGPASRDLGDSSYRAVSHAFQGNGLKPLSPVHLRVSGTGDLDVTWIRRSRVDGDGWDVPLGEEAERYRIEVRDGATLLREAEVTAPQWLYSAAMQAADGGTAGRELRVAQISASFGPGDAAVVML
ncbi:baseplate multidomain protein megatron [Pseudooceanicola sp. C21-150M6]|uniref:baseplate multidomain protein megatron n=1 Tax=Pseudooceanicola sp. C21-150M6 TaxID=3434355 RepID=UPI003D7F7DE3